MSRDCEGKATSMKTLIDLDAEIARAKERMDALYDAYSKAPCTLRPTARSRLWERFERVEAEYHALLRIRRRRRRG